ncbi:hypothetical protein [Caldivirga sp.]|uniref:hypothetical protein n=1 Tax=Caldivirga sp. TaxID=2080243 RepID=UPI003D0B3889
MVAEDEEHPERDEEEEEGGEEEELDVKEVARKAPEWSVGVIIYNNAAYPIARSKYAEGEFYFSTSWRAIKKGIRGELVVLKDGSTHKYRVKRRGDKYIQVVLLQ